MATPDPAQAGISPLAMLCAYFDMLLSKWESLAVDSPVNEQVLARRFEIMEVASQLTKSPALDSFRKALETSDRRATAALTMLAGFMANTVEVLLKRCNQLQRQQNWSAIFSESQIANVLAEALGLDFLRAQAQMALAIALRRTGELNGCIEAYERALAIPGMPDDLLAVAHDNVALTYTEIGKLDQALEHFEAALQRESDPRRRAAVFQNRALAFAELGEVDLAIRDTHAIIAMLENADAPDRQLPVNLDNAAVFLGMLKNHGEALILLERARGLFVKEDLQGRAANALNRSRCHRELGNKKESAAAFREGHDLAFELARRELDPSHYRKGFRGARAVALPPDDEAVQMWIEGVRVKELGEPRQALSLFASASTRARERGDHALAMKVDSNAAALFFDHRDLAQARALNERVFAESAQRGLARTETMALSGLANLISAGAEVHAPLGSLGLLARSEVLGQIHAEIVAAEEGLDPVLAKIETYDTGAVALSLGILAHEHFERDLAIDYFRDAIAKARVTKDPFSLVNRLSSLRNVLVTAGRKPEADEVVAEISSLAQSPSATLRGRIVAHVAIFSHAHGHRDAAFLIEQLRLASSCIEQLRNQLPQRSRTAISQSFPEVSRWLAQQLRESGQVEAAFDALQHQKGRRLVDALAAQYPGDGADAPMTVSELVPLLKDLSGQTTTALLEFAVDANGVSVYIVSGESCRSVYLAGATDDLIIPALGSMRMHEAALMRLCLTNELLIALAERICEVVPRSHRLLLIPDLALGNLPMHIIPVDGRPWCDRNEISYTSSAGALRFARQRRRSLRSALVAGDSAGDLPAATSECETVARQLGTEALVGKACSLPAIEEALRAQRNDIVHLAVHGRGDPKRGARASLLLRTGNDRLEWVSFDKLSAIGWRAGLVVFSGCSTAMGGLRDGRDFLSVADAAAETGAGAVIACLWPVYDQAAEIFMTAFYRRLGELQGPDQPDLRNAFAYARDALRSAIFEDMASPARRDGRRAVEGAMTPDADIAEYSVWAPFILVGDPLAGAGSDAKC